MMFWTLKLVYLELSLFSPIISKFRRENMLKIPLKLSTSQRSLPRKLRNRILEMVSSNYSFCSDKVYNQEISPQASDQLADIIKLCTTTPTDLPSVSIYPYSFRVQYFTDKTQASTQCTSFSFFTFLSFEVDVSQFRNP